ncbi:glucooligosaccharide oxidase [Microthyrium microscopicum]|uniref:Glucooligosaccharide oxidase n=1 Tax=Microthyrium microscopicum TaxID=703497 RepID=A0A6A6U7I5_9PEZI|nr:glucooligosaccharide oxidase [Microthyrium microscopicum]
MTKLEDDIKAALGHDEDLYAFPNYPLYSLEYVKRYNLDIDTTPAAVTFPKTTAHVAAIVKAAAANGTKVQGKSGGHSYANFSSPDKGVVVDLKHFQGYTIDTTTWQATVGAGVKLGNLTKFMFDSHKRAMAHGVCPDVGIGGHATIGGLGPSSRLWGAALDHILEVEVVLADGSIIRASEKQNSDIFWALKGAGGSFGIITEFVVRTEEAPDALVQYSFSFTTGSWSSIAPVFKAWQKFVSDKSLTRKFASTANVTAAGLIITGTYFGTQAEYDAVMKGFTFPGNASSHTVHVKDWLGAVSNWWEQFFLLIGGGIPARSYAKTLTFNGADLIPDSVVDKMFQYMENTEKGTLLWFAIFDLAGGAVNDVALDATAYAHRDALFYLQSYAIELNPLEAVSPKIKGFLTGLNKVIEDGMKVAGFNEDLGSYPGYVDLELKTPQKDYWRYNLPRLEEIKTKYDPKDIFHNPQSVQPAGQPSTQVHPVEKPQTPVEKKKKMTLIEKLKKLLC